jgi:hypothetical protein
MYKNWATVSESKSELNLSNAIIKNDTTRAGLIKFKSELDNSINQLSVKPINSADFISLNFRGLNYDIIVYKKLASDADYKDYLKSSFFYAFLSEKTK